jgi:hypothetical protein
MSIHPMLRAAQRLVPDVPIARDKELELASHVRGTLARRQPPAYLADVLLADFATVFTVFALSQNIFDLR